MTDEPETMELTPMQPDPLEPNMPSIPPAMILALVQAVIGLLVAFGLHLSDEVETAIIQLVSVLAVVIPAADAVIRHGRAKYYAARVAAQAPNTLNVTQENG